MGCSSSEVQPEPLDSNANSFSYMDLPNYDLFKEFMMKEKVQKYIQFYEDKKEVINGIFNDIKPLIDKLFKRFGIIYEII